MDDAHPRTVTRRTFLQAAGIAVTGFLVDACGRDATVVVTATTPPATSPGTTSVATSTSAPAAGTESALADLVLSRARILTMDAARSIAEAVAVRGDRILAVGSDEEIRAHVGPNTEIRDVGGRLVLPGIIDSHNHLQVWATCSRTSCRWCLRMSPP